MTFIFFRLTYDAKPIIPARTNRLLGTVVSLIGTTSDTTCGTINSTNPNGLSVSDQTYTVSCPATTEKTIEVLLSDNVMEQTGDKTRNHMNMNIAEVMVYKVTSGKFCTESESESIPKRNHNHVFLILDLYHQIVRWKRVIYLYLTSQLLGSVR